MKLSNKLGLPQPLIDAVSNDSYSKGDAAMSVTGLLRPPRIAVLEAKHENELEEDVSSRIWSLMGQVVHGILERADSTGIAERRLSIEVEGMKISGQMDRYIEGTLQDYKVVTAYKFKGGQVPEEYEQQLNCYAEILRQNGHPVTKLEVVGILRDWSKLEAARDANYPQQQVIILPVSLWEEGRAKKFIRDRVILHKQAKVDLPECTDTERWAKSPVYAVMKKGAKRAVKLYGSKPEADAHASLDQNFSVVHRPGEKVRCRFYCSVSSFCRQYQEEKAQMEEEVAV